jgi:hypothetical protein
MLSIIIVNWNAGRQLQQCLTSIMQAKLEGFTLADVIVIDNGSNDDSLSAIGHMSLPLKVIRNDTNRGFAAACNQGAGLTEGDYLLFLNPDASLREDSLSVPLAFMEHPEKVAVGICGIQLVDESGQVARSCARFPSVENFAAQAIGLNKLPCLRASGVHMSDWNHATTCEVDHVIGAFFLVRSALFDALNGFDERFFVYLEDLDFSLRAHQAGWHSMYLTETQAFHSGGGTSRQVKAIRLFYSLRSRLLYGFKHFSATEAWLLLFITLAIEPWCRLAFAVLRGAWRDARNTLQAYVMVMKCLPDVLSTRPC